HQRTFGRTDVEDAGALGVCLDDGVTLPDLSLFESRDGLRNMLVEISGVLGLLLNEGGLAGHVEHGNKFHVRLSKLTLGDGREEAFEREAGSLLRRGGR